MQTSFPQKLKLALVTGVLFVVLTQAALAQTLKNDSQLMDKPSGQVIGASISAGTPAKIIERQGFWVRVEVSGRIGWMKASQLSFARRTGGPTAIDTGRLGTGNIVSTSAARGLSAKDLLNGIPRMDEVGKMVSFSPDAPAMKTFLEQGRVVTLAQSVSLKAPVPTAASQSSTLPVKVQKTVDSPKSAHKKGSDDW